MEPKHLDQKPKTFTAAQLRKRIRKFASWSKALIRKMKSSDTKPVYARYQHFAFESVASGTRACHRLRNMPVDPSGIENKEYADAMEAEFAMYYSEIETDIFSHARKETP